MTSHSSAMAIPCVQADGQGAPTSSSTIQPDSSGAEGWIETVEQARAFIEAAVRSYWRRTALGAELREPFVASDLGVLTPRMLSAAETFGNLAVFHPPERAGWFFGEYYSLLLPNQFRRQHGIYSTPPALAEHLLKRALKAKRDCLKGRVLDPACGAGALLLPVLRRLIDAHQQGDVLAAAEKGLRGYDVDPFAAWITQVMIDAALLPYAGGRPLPRIIEVRDALGADLPQDSFDLILMNPPSGWTSLDKAQRQYFARSTQGRSNLYALFLDQATRLARPGGVIVALTPTSYFGGQFGKRLRKVLATEAPPLTIDFITDQANELDNVLQDRMITSARKGAALGPVRLTEAELRDKKMVVTPIGSGWLPHDPSDPWTLPRQRAHKT